jgi:hypothetical protein
MKSQTIDWKRWSILWFLMRISCVELLSVNTESASRLLIILVIMTMQFGRINAFNEMYVVLKE